MKRNSLLILVLTLLPAMLHAQKDWANFERYERANVELLKLPQSQRQVVFMGNSITEGWVSQHPDFFSRNGYVGRGISGQTTYQMLLRFCDDVIALHPKAVVINGGTNDIAQNNHTYVEDRTYYNLTAMCQLARENGIKVILTSVTPCDHYPWRPKLHNVAGKIRSLNERLAKYARKHKITFVDYHAAMADGNGAMLPGLSKEGCHPTARGYDVMEELIDRAIRKTVRLKTP